MRGMPVNMLLRANEGISGEVRENTATPLGVRGVGSSNLPVPTNSFSSLLSQTYGHTHPALLNRARRSASDIARLQRLSFAALVTCANIVPCQSEKS